MLDQTSKKLSKVIESYQKLPKSYQNLSKVILS